MQMKSLAVIAATGVIGAVAHGQVFEYEFSLSGDQEVPPVMTDGNGTASVTLDQGAGMISWEIHFDDLSGPATAAHFHGPAEIGEPAGVRQDIGGISGTSSPMIGEAEISPDFVQEVLDGLWYVNIHTSMHPGGEIRGQVIDEVTEYRFPLSGDQEVPAVMTDGQGTAEVVLNRGTGIISWEIHFSDLSGPATAAHFHGPAEIGEPAGVRQGIGGISGLESPMIGETEISPDFVQEVLDGLWYVNIHTSMHPGGEIRGQVIDRGACYADCDESGDLDFFDFLCFQNEFAAGETFADCDFSGDLDFFDFLCFQNEFAAGCP